MSKEIKRYIEDVKQHPQDHLWLLLSPSMIASMIAIIIALMRLLK